MAKNNLSTTFLHWKQQQVACTKVIVVYEGDVVNVTFAMHLHNCIIKRATWLKININYVNTLNRAQCLI